MTKRVLVGLSGGVDSAVSAYLLKEQGYDVTAGFMINYLAPEGEYCPTKEDLEEAKKVANFLEIPFFTFDYRKDYEKKVLDYMYEGYRKGITPNPDIMCNSEVKFKVFLDEALELGFDYIAMGHYAQIVEKDGIFYLKKGVDENKDQSYFLAGLNQKQLSKAIFPIGHLKKTEVRELALKIKLPNAKRKDSQGICFVGKVDLTKFLEKKINPKPGVVKDTSGKILGEHKGVFYYTIGQRKGLDIGGQKEPIFVVKKDLEKNEIIVGTSADLELYDDYLELKNLQFLSKKISLPAFGKAKIRYRQKDQNCILNKNSDGKYFVKFSEKQRAITSGQIFAFYDENDFLLASGVID
ncbi:tRNA 2-thiouridine(34) synthase MnmA [Candidatus Gracilibacteria bacterium]|nr:tRNA 2-thiouridine(34) synthase MnmA [Candidatus Gracilibacteria bacterium]